MEINNNLLKTQYLILKNQRRCMHVLKSTAVGSFH